MFTDSVVLTLYFETPLHAPSGNVLGPIDLPVQRERTTQWPMVHALDLEQALREAVAEHGGDEAAAKLFGTPQTQEETDATQLSVGDARVLLYPARSSVAPFLWLTCPAVLSRLRRDLARTVGIELPPAPSVKTDEIVTTAAWKHGTEPLAVEDVVLKPRNGFDAGNLFKLFPTGGQAYDAFAKEVEPSLGVVSDEVFGFLVRSATEVRPTASDERGTVYEEVLPPDTMFYVPLAGASVKGKGKKKESAMQLLEKHIGSYVRVGDGEHLGRGWARLALLKAEGVAE